MNKGLDMQNRAASLSVSSQQATPFGCCNFFDACTQDIMSLHYAGSLGLLDWMGFNVSDECYRSLEFISYVRPARSEGNATVGYISDPCADPNGIEFGTCKLTVEDFGLYGRQGPSRKILVPKRYCVTDPRRRLDGTLLTDEREWDMRFTMDVMLQDIMKDLVSGNASTPGQFDGLERWVRTGYTNCSLLDSIVIDWNGRSLDGGAGITWNGAAIAATWNWFDVFQAAVRRIKQRISWSPVLRAQRMGVGDMILVMPTDVINCVLNHYTCWSVCPGAQYNEVNLNTYEARQFRDRLNGGAFGFGRVFVDGFEIPIMPWDWNLINGPSRGDMYLLTGSVGSNRIWEGEFLSAQSAMAKMSDAGNNPFFSLDGGRVLGTVETDNLCRIMKLWMSLRLFCRAPWAQVRFQDVACASVAGFLSPDPAETSFYPLTSFTPANCP